MKRTVIILVMLVIWIASATAQQPLPHPRLDIAQVSMGEKEAPLEVFKYSIDGENNYFLSLGNMGIGGKVIQFQIDPLFEFFIPLGKTLDEVTRELEKIQGYCKEAPKSSRMMEGCLDFYYPKQGKEQVKVTTRRSLIIGRTLEFALEREGYNRATYISSSNIKSLIKRVKSYRKIHPKEE